MSTSVRRDQARWRAVRAHLNGHRAELTAAALARYPSLPRVEGTPLLAPPEWLPDHPVAAGDIALQPSGRGPAPAVTGREEASAGARPLHPGGGRYASYADAVGELDRPRLFEDRPCYRLLDVRWPGSPCLGFGAGSYFDVVNLCEALAHELAAAPSTLPLRELAGDPFDLTRRIVVPALCVLTLRRDRATGSSTFVMHWRDPGRVASGGGLYQVMPVGVFQPAGESPADLAGDLDLWRSMTREFSEEFLGHPERRGAIDYASWPFARSLDAARAEGRARADVLGIGVDPLTLAADLLVAVVIDSDVYDALFAHAATTNDEGRVVRTLGPDGDATGIAFTGDVVSHVTTSRPVQAAGAAVLRLAWRHRDALLDG